MLLNVRKDLRDWFAFESVTIKKYALCGSALENVQLYMMQHCWILFKNIVSIFLGVSIVSIKCGAEWT